VATDPPVPVEPGEPPVPETGEPVEPPPVAVSPPLPGAEPPVAVSPGDELPEQALAAQHSMTPTERVGNDDERTDERRFRLGILSLGKKLDPF
jgi:hypothetical protein